MARNVPRQMLSRLSDGEVPALVELGRRETGPVAVNEGAACAAAERPVGVGGAECSLALLWRRRHALVLASDPLHSKGCRGENTHVAAQLRDRPSAGTYEFRPPRDRYGRSQSADGKAC